MKRAICVLALFSLALACGWGVPRRIGDPEELMRVWEEAIRSRNLDAFASCYWEDAAQWHLMPDGYMQRNEGIGSIIEHEARIFEEVGPELQGFRLPELQVHGPGYTGLPLFIYDNPELGTTELFWFGERGGRVRIERQLLIPWYLEDTEVGPVQGWADENRDGALQRREQQILQEALWRVTHEPHPVENPLDEFCDWNENGRIDEPEAVFARAVFFRDNLRRGYIYFPEFARRYLDQNRSGAIDLGEVDMALEVAFGGNGGHPVETPLDEQIDIILDGVVSRIERDIFRRIVEMLVASVPEWPVLGTAASGGVDRVFAWADANADGVIGEEELRDIGSLLRGVAGHREFVISPIGLLFDENRDLRFSPEEKEYAAAELLMKTLREAFQGESISFERSATVAELDLNEDGWLDSREIEIFAAVAMNPEKLVEQKVKTPLERRIDRAPRDGKIDEWEVFSFTEEVFSTIAETWLLQSDWIGRSAVGLTYGDRPEDELAGRRVVASREDAAREEEAREAEAREMQAREAEIADAGPDAEGPEVEDTAESDTGEASKGKTGTLTAAVTLAPVFPVLFKYLDTAPVGTVEIKNGLSTEVKNLQVKLSMQRYMDSPRVSAAIESLAAGEETTVDLMALFNEDVLDLTEGTRTAAQVVIDYEDDSGARQLAITETLTFYDRNAIRWDDDEKVAAFVTARDPQIRLLATNMTALIRRTRNQSISENLQNAMALYAALIEHNLGYNIDPTSSYKELSKDALSVDYVQFPRQTLMFKGGDCDDLSVCYASLLEAIGIPSAFITVPGHIFTAFGLKMDSSTAKARFSDPEDLIFAEDGTVWIPVEVTKLNDTSPDFLDAWAEGAKQWREHNGRDQARLIPTSGAWETYEPVAASFMTATVALPDTEKVLETFQRDLARFVNLEIADQELTLQGKLSGDPDSPKLLNLLGTLYARYGLSDKAEEKFEAAVAEQEYYSALMNLGHLEFLQEEYAAAAAYYGRALAVQPESAKAILAAARADHELENYGNVKRYYAQLEQLDSELAEEYAYLDLRASESVRAQESSRLRSFVLWESED